MNQLYAAAEKKAVPFGILIDNAQAGQNLLTLKNLQTRQRHENITVEKAAEIIAEHKSGTKE